MTIILSSPTLAALKPKLVLSAGPHAMAEAGAFDCGRDRIYAILKFPEPVPGRHVLEAAWYAPDGKVRERTRVPLVLGSSGDSAYAWLRFHFNDDVVAALSGESGDRRFDGRWRVDVFWDKKKIAEKHFLVECG